MKKTLKKIGYFVLGLVVAWFSTGHYEKPFWMIIHSVSCLFAVWFIGKGIVHYWNMIDKKQEEKENEDIAIRKLMFVIQAETGDKYTKEELRMKASNVYWADEVIIW